jgi:hypothetical protein
VRGQPVRTLVGSQRGDLGGQPGVVGQAAIGLQQGGGLGAGGGDELLVLEQGQQPDARAGAGLGGTQDVTLAAGLEVEPGELEAVGGRRDRGQPLPGRRRHLHVGDEEAEPGVLPAGDATAELVQLADPEPVGVHHDHDGGVGDVDADLDDRRRDEHVNLPVGEGPHPGLLLVGPEPSVQDLEAQPGERTAPQHLGDVEDGERGPPVVTPGRRAVGVLGFVVGTVCVTDTVTDPGTDDIGLASGRDLLADP